MNYLEKEDVLLINRMTISRHGGDFAPPSNLLNSGPLEYLVEAVRAKMFEEEIYPEIHDKAAAYMFNIISNHVFQDGNKRTGLEAALLFLKLNTYSLREGLVKIKSENKVIPKIGDTSNEILYNFTIEVASGELTLEECRNWFKDNIQIS